MSQLGESDAGRKCIFCGAAARSGEHLFPDWFNSIFPVDPATEKPKLARHQASAERVATQSWSSVEIASATGNIVCHDCNTGWMSQLESRAKPVLGPMMQGHERTLNVNDQLLIATWACKTAMVHEAALRTDENCFSDSERSVVRRDDRPPASVEVSLSAVIGSIAPVSYSCVSVGAEVGREQRLRFHFHTIQAGPLVVNIVRRDPPPADYGSLGSRATPQELGVDFQLVSAIFPSDKRAKWPPGQTLDWDGFMRLALRGLDLPENWQLPEAFMPERDAGDG